ncbi:MAG: type II toxin-antitoxin system Phd/YefM family antitoxin [Magnetococcales bacterium]|nr:type II toxin-antitoxin system Phd/YefM family antitoxin [Magnetococcales bacterium]MBF0260554.1 type II toxin-antitoxin system Phd/YefM family antitoxin [Magnetococcales bacterium]
MSITTITSRQFNQDASKAKRAALDGPVFITDRGRPAHVLMTFDAYRKMSGEGATISALLAMPEGAEAFELEWPRWHDVAQGADLA